MGVCLERGRLHGGNCLEVTDARFHMYKAPLLRISNLGDHITSYRTPEWSQNISTEVQRIHVVLRIFVINIVAKPLQLVNHTFAVLSSTNFIRDS